MDPKAFWLSLDAAEKARREREHLTREAKVRPQYRVAQNDEPESPEMRAIREAGQADAQAVMRGKQP